MVGLSLSYCLIESELMKKIFGKQVAIALVLIVVVGGAFSLGYYTGEKKHPAIESVSGLSNKEVGEPNGTDFSLFWQAWNTLNEKYAGSTTPPSAQERVWGAIEGLAGAYGDPYTTFFPPQESKNFQEAVAGNFDGVGMEVGIQGGVLVVISPLKNTPASRAGVEAGDQILKIDKTDAATLSVDKAVNLIRGKKGTTVVLTLGRKGIKAPFVVSIVRDTIDIPTVDTEFRKKDGVFVLRLYSFSALSPGLFRDGLRQFAESGSDKLVIDLRNNPGGYLEAAVDMASWFLPVGKVVVTEDFGKAQDPQVYRSKGYNVFSDNLKLVILLNAGSASASEILAGALHDQGKATLVGEKSFGKGSVQELVDLPGKTSLKVTIARWLTPNGTSISGNGITPDVVVEMNADDVKAGKDTQLEKAAAVLLNKK
jgi:carboxyl-terminal processing protease